MTREELRDEIFDMIYALNAGIGTAEELRVATDILARFDRFKDKQWKPVTEPPEVTETVSLIFEVTNCQRPYVEVWWGYNPGEHWPPHERYTGGRWRVMPKPPKGDPDADA